MEEGKFVRLKAIFEDDGEEIRRQFILAGLLLTIFERFKTYVVEHVDGFFAERTSIVDGEIRVTRGDEFKELVRAHGKGQSGQHANATFRAAIHWLASFNALDARELSEVERLYSLRNEIGHQLLQILADDRKKPIEVFDILTIFHVYVNVTRWWVREVELPTDPDMTEEDWEKTNLDSIESLDTALLREIMYKALAGIPDWESFKVMVEQFRSSGPAPEGGE